MRQHAQGAPKYKTLLEYLKAGILSGRYEAGQKLPSEAVLVQRHGVSRITVSRALRELQQLGLIERIAGSGSYVRNANESERPHIFGLLIPDLGETEIFEPICRAIANAPEAEHHGLLWGHADPGARKSEQAWQLCRRFIDRNVAGVFFAPLEFEADATRVNARILSALRGANIPVILLDRWASAAPKRNRPDLVGINNRHAGYVATEHLIGLGARRIGFLGYHGSASTIADRMAGYRDALRDHGLKRPQTLLLPDSAGKGKMRELSSVDAFVCVNDRIAGQLIHLFLASKVRVPRDVRVVGIDDVAYAELLPVPLTTVRQPVQAIGRAALQLMLERIRQPKLPPRALLFDGELVIRQSCGASMP